MGTGYIVANGAQNPEDSVLIVPQPMGWDQWVQLYNHYVVLGSKITVTFAPMVSANPIVCGVYLTDAPALPYASYSQFIEAGRGMHKLITPESKPVTTMSRYSAKKFYNVKDVKDNLDRLGNTTTANPFESAYYHVWLQSADKQTTSAIVYAIITVEYTVLFSEPKDLPAS